MTYLSLPSDETRRLSFYLAMEEYATRSTNDGSPFFFLWQVEPTVIFGRHQVIENEVNITYCREHGIQFYRRKSGGGCVYADEQNLMLSFVTSEVNTGLAFNHFINMVVLRSAKLSLILV